MDAKSFLNIAQERIAIEPGRIPFNSKEGNLVLNWLRALLEKTEKDLDKLTTERLDRAQFGKVIHKRHQS